MKKLFFVLSFILVAQIANAQLFTKEKIKNQENIDKMMNFELFEFEKYCQNCTEKLSRRDSGVEALMMEKILDKMEKMIEKKGMEYVANHHKVCLIFDDIFPLIGFLLI